MDNNLHTFHVHNSIKLFSNTHTYSTLPRRMKTHKDVHLKLIRNYEKFPVNKVCVGFMCLTRRR